MENNNSETATGVKVTVNLPPGITYVSVNSDLLSCNQQEQVLFCELQLLESDSSKEFEATFESSEEVNSSISFTVLADQIDSYFADNRDETSMRINSSQKDKSISESPTPEVASESKSKKEWYSSTDGTILLLSYGLLLWFRNKK